MKTSPFNRFFFLLAFGLSPIMLANGALYQSLKKPLKLTENAWNHVNLFKTIYQTQCRATSIGPNKELLNWINRFSFTRDILHITYKTLQAHEKNKKDCKKNSKVLKIFLTSCLQSKNVEFFALQKIISILPESLKKNSPFVYNFLAFLISYFQESLWKEKLEEIKKTL